MNLFTLYLATRRANRRIAGLPSIECTGRDICAHFQGLFWNRLGIAGPK